MFQRKPRVVQSSSSVGSPAVAPESRLPSVQVPKDGPSHLNTSPAVMSTGKAPSPLICLLEQLAHACITDQLTQPTCFVWSEMVTNGDPTSLQGLVAPVVHKFRYRLLMCFLNQYLRITKSEWVAQHKPVFLLK